MVTGVDVASAAKCGRIGYAVSPARRSRLAAGWLAELCRAVARQAWYGFQFRNRGVRIEVLPSSPTQPRVTPGRSLVRHAFRLKPGSLGQPSSPTQEESGGDASAQKHFQSRVAASFRRTDAVHTSSTPTWATGRSLKWRASAQPATQVMDGHYTISVTSA